VAAQVHAHHGVELIVAHAEYRLVAAEAGVVDHDVEIAVGIECRFHQVVGVGAVGAVTQYDHRLAAKGPDFRDG
jgi:hypothetical protein